MERERLRGSAVSPFEKERGREAGRQRESPSLPR